MDRIVILYVLECTSGKRQLGVSIGSVTQGGKEARRIDGRYSDGFLMRYTCGTQNGVQLFSQGLALVVAELVTRR